MRHRVAIAGLSLALLSALSGCASPLLAGLSLSEFGFASSLFATAATGKGLGEHAMDVVTGRDCRIIEGLARKDRKFCERKNSPALEKDWKGLASLADDTAPDAAHSGLDPELPDTPGS